jgi:uncharacterized membrane protein YbhN (UPF0104 family)
MSDTPPKVTEFFITFALASVPIILIAIFTDGFNGFDRYDALCLGTLAIPFLVIFLSYKWLEKHRETKTSKETVQKLGLDD